MPTVRLGNHAARHPDGRVDDRELVTSMTIPDEDPHEDRMRNITHADGLWAAISAAPPAWVASDDPELETALAAHFGCRIGGPDDYIQDIDAVHEMESRFPAIEADFNQRRDAGELTEQ